MGYMAIEFCQRDNVALVTLSRPEAGNAINAQMALEMQDVCQRISQDSQIKAAIITGAGSAAFCSGEDMAEFADSILSGSPSPASVEEIGLRYSVSRMVAGIECPVVAALNGNAFGPGLAVALACDLRIASARALLGVPDLKRGYFLPSGITQWLPRIVGRGKALELILTAHSIDAAEAYRIGLVHRVVPDDQVLSEAEKVATEIAAKGPLAVRYAKEAVRKGMDMTLEQGLRLECDLYMILHTTHDRTEGIKAFREKREPSFRGD